MLYLLVEDGYATHPKLQQWDISPKGRRVFKEMPNRPLGLFAEE